MGSILGDWDDQLEKGESHIVRFVALGPKFYSYQTNTGREELKAKGIMQNGYTEDIVEWDTNRKNLESTGKKLNFEQLKRLLCGDETSLQVLYPHFFRKNGRTQKINICSLTKEIKLVYD